MSRRGEPETGDVSDDDSISITSTAASEEREEYPVEAIIAERKIDGSTEYLVRWEGYPDERCTWEPETSFQNEDTLLDWKTQEMRVSRGLATSCDVDALLDRVEDWVQTSERRKSRRRAKRIRLGVSVTPREIDIDEDGQNEDRHSETEPEQELEQDQLQQRKRISSEKIDKPSKSRRRSDLPEVHVSTLRLQYPSEKARLAWSEAEENSLIQGLKQVNGPYYHQILDLYGASGSVNDCLKFRATSDLQAKTQQLYEEFQDNEIEIPDFLQFLGPMTEMRTNPQNTANPAPTAVMFRPQRPDEQISSHPKSTSKSSSASPTKTGSGTGRRTSQSERDSILSKSKLSASSSPFENDSARVSKSKMSSALPSKSTSSSSNKERPSRAEDVNQSKPKQPGSKPSLSLNTHGIPSDRAANPRSTPTTAGGFIPHTATRETHKPRQMGKTGRGPARLGVLSRKSPLASSKKAFVSGSAILKNWNKPIKPRKSRSFQPDLSKVNENRQETFGKFSVARKYEKAGRNEPAPDIEKLVFIDLKRAAKKPALSWSELERSSKTPYEMIQEGLLNDVNKSALTDPSDLNLPETVVEKSTSSATETLDQIAKSSDNSGLLQKDSDRSPAKAQEQSIPGPRKRPSLPFEAYIRHTAPYLSTANKNKTVPTTSEKPRAETALTDSPQQHHETSKVQQDVVMSEPEPTQAFTDSLDSRESKLASIRNVNDSITKTAQDSTPDDPLYVRREQGISTQALISDTPVTFSTEPGPLSMTSTSNRPSKSSTPTKDIGNSPASDQQSRLSHGVQNSSLDILALCNSEVVKGDVIGTIMIGPDDEDLGVVRFRGLGVAAYRLLLEIKTAPRELNIRFKQICTAVDYQSFYHLGVNDFIGAGYVAPFTHSMEQIARMAETLKIHASGGIFTSGKFSMLIYPVDSGLESWDFLNESQSPIAPGAVLRVVVRTALPAPSPVDLDMQAKRSKISFREGEGNTSLVLRNVLGIDYERLIKQPNPLLTEKSNNFFLLFNETAKREFHIIFKFLEEHQANIYTWETDGAWDYFCTQMDAGVILIEGSFYGLYKIPNLARLLRKPINVFNLTFHPDRLAPHPHINRLFPHGCALLLTDSFLLLCPHEAARFMRWFRLQVLANKPAGTWKICTRPAIRDYILTLVGDRNKEEGHVYMQIYENIWYILPEELMEDDEWEVPKDEAPVYCMSGKVSNFNQAVGKGSETNTPMDEHAIAGNDATQVYWFAGWAMTQLENFRRFHVISGARADDGYEAVRKDWTKKWSHINVFSGDAAFKLHKIPEWEAQDKECRDRLGPSIKDKPPHNPDPRLLAL